VVGDFDLPGSGGLRGALGLPAPQPSQRSRLELLSDPMGVDFKPYLIQILAAVKRNWLAVIPESARLGRQGRVQIQFAIARNGQVPKLVIALPSGTDALDRAAVAGISASNPFPPLPAEYRAEQIRLQFTFLYNMN
jgi:TonB family protein